MSHVQVSKLSPSTEKLMRNPLSWMRQGLAIREDRPYAERDECNRRADRAPPRAPERHELKDPGAPAYDARTAHPAPGSGVPPAPLPLGRSEWRSGARRSRTPRGGRRQILDLTCDRCGQHNPSGSRYCNACGTSLIRTPERRRLVTLLFCDVSGSTQLGEQMDAESVRDLMSEYFREMRSVIESHGGTIEKFIGDAIVAVFGMPEAHEDDALRAVSAANDMAKRLEALNQR